MVLCCNLRHVEGTIVFGILLWKCDLPVLLLVANFCLGILLPLMVLQRPRNANFWDSYSKLPHFTLFQTQPAVHWELAHKKISHWFPAGSSFVYVTKLMVILHLVLPDSCRFFSHFVDVMTTAFFIASSSFVSGHVNLKTWLVTENSLAASSAFRLGSEKVDPEVQDYSQLLFLNFGDPVSLCGLKPYIIPGFRLLYCILPGFLPHSRFIEMLLRRVLCRLILAFILLFSDTPNSLIIMIHFIKYIWGLQHTVIGDKMLPIVKQIKTSIISLS